MRKYSKPERIVISETDWKQIFNVTYRNIQRKLDAAKSLIDHDAELSAGLYTYAIEEFGKLLLLKQGNFQNGKCTIQYRDEFVNHTYKFEIAFDYLQDNNAGHCILLTQGDFSIQDFAWRDFYVGLPADFESRLSIFYSDLSIHDNGTVEIVPVPNVDEAYLRRALDGLEKILLQLS